MGKYTVHGGHGYPGKGAIGVVGYLNESIEDRIVKDKVKLFLELDGNAVTDITVDEGSQNEILSKLTQRANAVNADLNVSIHFNAANGSAYGTETWIKAGDNRAKGIAEEINRRIVALGYRDRGVKSTSNLYVLNKMTAPTLLVECCFADNVGDFQRYDAEKMAFAIACGIVGHDIQIPQPVKHTAELLDVTVTDEKMPVFRLYNKNTGDHFYTTSVVESDVLIDAGWVLESRAWYAPNVVSAGAAIHRLYNPNSGLHHFTASGGEASYLDNIGWVYEGICFCSDASERVPVHKLYNESSGQHHYTVNQNEVDSLKANGWEYEGICFYAVEA